MLTVVVLAHNRDELTRQCLDALVSAEGELEVMLVDNASDAGILSLGREFQRDSRNVRYLRLPRSLSFAVANNVAAREARGDVLLFLNNDVIVSSAAPARLAAEVRAVGGVSGTKLVFPDTGLLQHAGMCQMLWGYASNLGTCARPDHGNLNHPCDMFAVTGAMLAISRSLFWQVGGFDERYRWGYEDVDLCLKARAAGARVQYVPGAASVHAESATLGPVWRPADLDFNYALYRRRWNYCLVPAERRAVARIKRACVRRVVIFGTGLAAAGLCRTLTRYGIDVTAFTASTVDRKRYCGRPVLSLEELDPSTFDRLFVGTQHYYSVREYLARFDPTGEPHFPAIDAADVDAHV